MQVKNPNHSQELWQRAQKALVGGVNSPVRAFKAVGGQVRFMQSAKGAILQDADNKQYIDYVGAFGPAILGHAQPEVVAAIQVAAESGSCFGASSALEIDLAEAIKQVMPSLELIRFVNSGTEAAMTAIRLARAATGRDLILKFKGCYHGHCDSMLVEAGSGPLTLGVPSSAGVTSSVAANTLLAEFNDLDSVYNVFENYGTKIAAIIVEPIAGNMNFIMPRVDFLPGLREISSHYGALLIFDEVMTGFRVAHGGAQAMFGVRPDLTMLGKVIGGGLPIGAVGGRADLMQQLAPCGPVYQAGTLSGNPLAMAAGLATLRQLSPASYAALSESSQKLCQGLRGLADDNKIALAVAHCAGMWGICFSNQPVNSYEQLMECDSHRYSSFFNGMLHKGVYLPPSAYESCFMSLAHAPQQIEKTLLSAAHVFENMRKNVA